MRIDGCWQQVAIWHIEDPHQEEHLVFPDAMQAALQLGHGASGNVPARHLQFGRQFALRPVSIHPQSADLRPDDVVD